MVTHAGGTVLHALGKLNLSVDKVADIMMLCQCTSMQSNARSKLGRFGDGLLLIEWLASGCL